MGCSSGPDVVEDGLVLCLDAGSKRSYPGTGTTWTDTVGGISGSFVNQTVFDSSNAGSLSFDGADDAVQLNSFPQLFSDSFTVSIWAYKEQSSVRDIFFGSCCVANSVNFEVLADNSVRFWWNYGQKDVRSATGISTTGWQYLVYQRDRISSTSSTVKMYYNNNLIKNITYGTNFSDTTTPSTFYLGRDARTNTGTPLYGKISIMTIHNRALTADEIRRNYLSTKERYQ